MKGNSFMKKAHRFCNITNGAIGGENEGSGGRNTDLNEVFKGGKPQGALKTSATFAFR